MTPNLFGKVCACFCDFDLLLSQQLSLSEGWSLLALFVPFSW